MTTASTSSFLRGFNPSPSLNSNSSPAPSKIALSLALSKGSLFILNQDETVKSKLS